MPTQQDLWNQSNWNWNQQNTSQSMNPWQQMSFDPSNPFGQTWFNPNGVGANARYAITPEMMFRQAMQNVDWGNQLTAAGLQGKNWLSPGLRSINFGGGTAPEMYMEKGQLNMNLPSIWGMFGGGAGVGANQAGLGAPPEWQYTAPEGWGGYQFDTNTIDPQKAMEAWQPWAEEQRKLGFKEAAGALGPNVGGMAMSTPYASALGTVARHSTEDLGRIGADYMFQAAQANAANQLQRQLAEQQAALNAWQTQGGWNQAAQLAQNQYGLGGWQSQMQNQLASRGLDLQQMGQQMMFMNMLQGLLGGLF